MNGNGLKRWGYAAVGVIVLLFAGLVYAWSVLSSPIAAEFPDWSKTQLSFTFTLTMILFCAGCLAGGFFGEKINVKINLILCGILFCIGFFLASNTQSVAMLYLGFGVFGGIASGFSYNAVMSTIMKWFPDKSGMISGILLMGFGIGSFIIGKVYQALTPAETGGWRTSFRVFAVILAVVMIVAGLILKKPDPGMKFPQAPEKKTKVKIEGMDAGPGGMMKRSSFWLYYFWAVALSMAGLTLVSQASGIALEAAPGMDAGTLATIVGLISVFNGIGRVFFGILFDRRGHRVTLFVPIIIFIVAAAVIGMALRSHTALMITAGFMLGGFAYGAVNPMNSAIIRNFYGPTHYAANFSLINTNLIISSFASTIAGMLYDASGSYFSSIVMILITAAAGFVFYLGIKKP